MGSRGPISRAAAEAARQTAGGALDPACPRELRGAAARAEWRRLLEVLPSGSLAACDRAVLMGYCLHFARWIEAASTAAREGEVVVSHNEKGVVLGVTPNPWVKIGDRAHDRMLACARELGLTPASRARMGAPAGAPSAPRSGPLAVLHGGGAKRE